MPARNQAYARRDVEETTRDQKRDRIRQHEMRDCEEMASNLDSWLESRGLSKSGNSVVLKVPLMVETCPPPYHGPFVRKRQDPPHPSRLPLLPIAIRLWFVFWFQDRGMPCFRPKPPAEDGDWSDQLIKKGEDKA